MHIKFLKHGAGSAAGAAKYLLRDADSQGEKREAIEVLRGDPHQVAAVAESLAFDLKYRSAVIAWAPTDKPTPEQVDAVLNDFSGVAFAGMQDRVSWSAVRHDEKNGGVHVHVICARVDLESGKSFNPAPPGWIKVFDPIRDFHNAQHNWARPDDPARARIVEHGRYDLPPDKKVAKAALDAHIVEMVDQGLIRSRQDVVTELKNFGEITRQGTQYISVKPEGFDKAIRLKGAIYGEQFSIELGEKVKIEDSRANGNSRENRQLRIQEAKQQVEKTVRSRTKYNLGRYGNSSINDAPVSEIRLASDRRLNSGYTDRDRDGELGVHEVSHKPLAEHTDRVQQEPDSTIKTRQNAGESSSEPNLDGQSAERLAVKRRDLGSGGEIGYLMQNSNTEIERFKTEIDLGLYLESNGYQKDIYASCRSSAVFENGPDEKLVVGKQAGHFVYKNTRAESDQGSIIDFIQKRQGLSLGQVRKELRPALTGDYAPRHEWKAPAYAVDQAQDRWVKGREVFDFSYLKGRGIDPATVKAYSPAIRQDPQTKDLMFLHRGQQGFSGYEIKGPETQKGRFAAGGDKTFFPLQRGADPVSRVVITETALDALSKAQIEGCRKDTAYVSMAGNPSEDQLTQLKSLCMQPRIQTVVLAHDKDKGGDDQAEKCREALTGSPAKIERDTPAAGKDWNELLQQQLEQQRQAAALRQISEVAKAAQEEARDRNRDRGMSM